MQSALPSGASPVRVEGLPRWQSRRRGCGATRRYASVAVTGDPFGPGSPLQSPLRSDFRFYPYRLRSLALAAHSCTSYKRLCASIARNWAGRREQPLRAQCHQHLKRTGAPAVLPRRMPREELAP